MKTLLCDLLQLRYNKLNLYKIPPSLVLRILNYYIKNAEEALGQTPVQEGRINKTITKTPSSLPWIIFARTLLI